MLKLRSLTSDSIHDYIGAIRVSPDGDYQNSAEKFDKIGIYGQNAYPILIQDFENDSELLNKISAWYSENLKVGA
jgi:hypothetical protein